MKYLKEVRNRLIHLAYKAGLSRKNMTRCMIHDPMLEKIFTYTAREISEQLAIPMKAAITIYQKIHQHPYERNFQYKNPRVKLITIYDEVYPPQLKQIPDPPFLLYALGDLALLKSERSISVIGTRQPSAEALPKMKQLIPPLVESSVTIVSGLAYGIDSMAHQLTLNLSGQTIAVLGGGFNYIYPRENIPLFKKIIEKGLVLSEYAPNIAPKKYHFPERNRIISGLSNGTLVIEARERSGTLITVNEALEQGRDVYAVPGSILDKQTLGCHRMIQDGAKLVINATDILEDFH